MTQRSAGASRHGRRIVVGAGVLSAAALILTGCTAPSAAQPQSTAAISLAKPSSPIALTILDGGGDLSGGAQTAIDGFVKANPDLVSGVTYQTAAATDVAGKVLAQQSGGSVDISLVLGGPDVLGAGEKQNLFVKQLPDYTSSLPDLTSIQDDSRAQLQDLADGNGVLVNYDQNGPIIASNPSVVTTVPQTPEDILAWAKANPGKFAYAQPAASGSGRAFMMALPYLLGDTDPSDPVNGWSKTWAYLADLGQYVTSYPASSTILAQQFGAGQVDLLPTIVSHDINYRKNGTWPATTAVTLFTDEQWVADGHFAMIPQGVTPETAYVDLALETYLLQPDAQELRLEGGPLTTANKNVTVDNASLAVQQYLTQWGRPDFYPTALTQGTVHNPLTPDALVQAFDLWSKNIGSKVGG